MLAVYSCHNLQSCSVNANKATFGDPCLKTTKYLEVIYQCGGTPRLLYVMCFQFLEL